MPDILKFNDILGQPKLVATPIEDPQEEVVNFNDILSQPSTTKPAKIGEYNLTSKYDLGILPGLDINKIRASRQPWYEQAGAMVGQAVLGEVVGGTIMSIGSLFEAPEMIYNTITKEDDDFHNFIYDIGKDISDFSREEMPIYQSGDRFGDPGWWFQNGVSVASTLSMLLPGMAAAKVGRALGTGLKLGTTATNLLETGIGAATMRHSENFREASQVYDETLQLGQLARQQGKIDKTDDEIKHIASNAAALDYNANWANFAFDFIQLGSILKPFKDLTRNTGLLDYKLAKQAGKLPTSKLGKVAYWMSEPGKGILEQSSEGLEEVVNQISQYEGERKGKIDLGIEPDDNTTFGERLGDYLTRPETVDAFIWGTVGGLMFKPMARVLGMDRTDQQLERKLGELAGRENTIKEYAKHIDDVKNNRIIRDKEGRTIQDFTKATPEDKENFVHDITRKMGFNLGINAASAGNVDLVLDWLGSDTTHQSLIDSGVTTKENLQSDIKGIKDEVLRAERLYTKNFQRLYESPIQDATKRRILNKSINIEYNRENNLETIKNLETEYTKLHNEDPFIQQNMSNPAIENTIKQAGLGIAIATLKNDLTEAKAEGNTYAVERIEKILPILEKKLENVGKVELINPKLLDFRLTQNIAQQELLKEYNNILAEDLSDVDSKENVKKVNEEVKNDEKTIQNAISSNRKTKEQNRRDERLQQEKELVDEYETTQKLIITKEDRQQLVDLGYTKEDIAEFTPEKAQEVITSQTVKPTQKVTEPKTTVKEPTSEFLNEQFDKLTVTEGENRIPEFSDKSLNEIFDELEIQKVKQEQESEKIVKSNIDDEYVNDTKHEDIEKSIDRIDQDLLNDNGSKSSEDGEIIYENSKIENGHNALAHLDREYERIKEGKTVRYADKTNQLSDKAPKEILNPDKFGVGTEVTFVVDDKDDVEIYDPRKEGKELTTWGEYKQWLRDNNKGVDITTLQEYKDNVPIRMTHEGVEYNAFLHTASWINEENIKSNIEEDKKNIRLIREGIVQDGKFETTINSRTNGVLFKVDKRITLRESVGEDPNYTLGVGTGDNVRIGKGKLFEGSLINNNHPPKGSTVIAVKVNGNNYLSIPVTRRRIGNDQLGNSVIDTIITACNIFLENDVNHPLRMAVLNSKENGTTGDDITTPQGLDNFVQNFVHSYRSEKTDLDDLVKTRSISTTSNDRYFSVKNGVIYLFDGLLTGRVISVSKGGQKFREEFFDKLNKSLPNFFMNTHVETLGNDRRVALLNENGEVEFKNYKDLILDTSYTNVKGNQVDEVDGKPVYSYTISPVIRVDFSKFIKQEETKVESPIDKPNPTPQDFKDMVNNFDPNESFALGTTEKQSKYLVKELGVYHQEVITNHIFRNIVKDIINTPDVDKNLVRNKWLSQFKEKMESMKELYANTTDPKTQLFLDRVVNPVLNNFDTISRLVNIKLLKVNNIIGKVNDDVDLEFEDSEGNERAFTDRSQYETKLSLSAEVKRLFAVLDGDRKNFLGENNIVDYQEVDNVVKGIVAGLDPDFEIMMSELEKYTQAHSWMRQLIDNLRNSPESTQNLFVYEMNHHYVEHLKGMWSEENGKFNTNLQVDNETSSRDQIISNWNSNLLNSDLVDSEHKFKDIEGLKKEYKEIKDAKDLNKARAWLEKLGIKISDGLWNTIQNGKYIPDKKEVKAEWFITSSYSPFNHIYNKISKLGSSSLDDIELFKEISIEKLAKEESKFNSNIHSSSHRAGGKTVNSYGKNKFIVDWQRYLTNGKVAEEIMKSPFHSTSLLLDAYATKDKSGEDNSLTKNFQMAIVSLQALKKHKTKDRENMELHNLGEDEYEMFNMTVDFSSLPDEMGNSARIIAPLFPTTSDKSTAHMYKWPAVKIGFNPNGTIDQETRNTIYTQCILPEIRRIKLWENIQNAGKEFRTSQFATGGHMFHMIPAMNNIQGIWNADGTININVESLEFRKSIDALIDDVVNTLVEDKLDVWRKYGFTTADKDRNLSPTMINTKILYDKGVLEGVAKENYVRVAATDLVYQNLIFNANMFTGIIGDPAHVFKSKIYKETVSKLIKDGTITSEQSKDVAYTWSKFTPDQRVQTVGNVFDNVGKRLAGVIAPRKQGANTTSTTIKYLLVNDKAIDSKSIDQYRALLNGKDAEEYSSKGMLKESTNAQEFTTMLEHLSSMQNAGLLPDGFYKEISEIITREIGKKNYYYTNAIRKGLSEKNLEFFNNKLVLQVTKPIYYWNEISKDGLGLVPVYIKSSAYPLLPEATVGTEMDKIRILMESKGKDRLSFGSATKLGMPGKPIDLWGADGKVRDNITDEEIGQSSIVADRRGFGFQQEVPYEALKEFINRVSQADKNLFTNILAVGGFIYNGKEYRGSQLREIYNTIYGDLYDIGYQDLVDEIEAKFDKEGNVISFNREKVKKALMDEAVKRDYPLNDIDGLDLDEALDFIAFMPSSDKYEALLNAIVKSRVLKIKFRGKSLVLSTEEGYQQDKSKSYEELTKDEKSGIVYTNSFKDELDPGHFEDKNGNRLTGEQLKKAWEEGTAIVKRPAQVLIPWKFQWYNKDTKQQEILDITKFVGEDGRIDESKLPTELLYALGMRIPNQGHNSQSWIEIVGFLPKRMGDIVVAPRDFLAQMGSDFDVDKLYSYMYNYIYLDGKLERLKDSSFNDKVAENDLLIEDIKNNFPRSLAKEIYQDIQTIKNLMNELTLTEEDFNALLDNKRMKYEILKVQNAKDAKELSKEIFSIASEVYSLKKNYRKFELQNRLLDIHIAIQANTNPLVQKQIYEPLGFWKFKEMADEIANAQPVDPYFTPISDEYQKQRRISAAMGKVLVGDMANGLMFISASQGNKLQLHTGGQDPKPFYIRFGNKTSNGDLSNPFTIDTIEKLIKAIAKKDGIKHNVARENIDDYTERVLDYLDLKDIEFRSQVMSGLLSAAVDNQNEQILDKFNLNSRTSKYTKLLTVLGFGEEAVYLVRQPIIVDYFNELKRLRSTLGAYNANAQEQAERTVREKYISKDFDRKRFEEEFDHGKGLGIDNMKKSILEPDNNFNYIQLAALEQLLYIESHADKLQSIQSAINTDSKGLDKSLLETISKEDAVDRIRNANIFNISSILDNSIWGHATDKGLRFNNKLWSNIFPYKQQGLTYMFERLEQIVGKDDVSSQTKANFRSDVWRGFKSYIYSLQELGLYSGDIKAERERLMMGENSLASIILKIQKLPAWTNHPFISRLDPQVRKNLPSLVYMDAGLDQAGEMLVMQSALDLYMNDRPIEGTDYTTRKLFRDLVSLAYLNGGIQGAVQYLRFLPISYLFDSGVAGTIQGLVKNKSFEDTEFMNIPHDGMPYWVQPSFIINYVQHNTRGLTHLKKASKTDPGYKTQIRTILEDKNLSTNAKVTKFALTDSNIKVKRIIGGIPTMVSPEFLVIPDDGRKGRQLEKNVVFMYTGESTPDGYSIYHRISNKGIFAMDEYTYSKDFSVTNSIINSYNTFNTPTEKVNNYPVETQGSTSFTNPEVEENRHVELLKIVDKGGVKEVKDILTQIALHSENPFSQILAEEMSKHTEHIQGVKFDSTTTREGVAGVYSNDTIYVNLKDSTNSTLDGIGETILHEVQHAYINEQVVKYLKDPKSVPQGIRSAIGDMVRIQSIFKSRLIAEIGQDKYNELVGELNNIKNKKGTGRYSREDLNLVHATTDIREFFTLSLTNSDIQSRLNKIDDPENKISSLFDRVIQVVKRMLEAIGFDLNRNSLLVGAIENNITMIRNSRPVEITSVQPTQLKMFEENKPIGITFQEEQTSGYRNRTIKNASADATIAIAVDFNSAGEKLTKSSVLSQGKKYISVDGNNLVVTPERVKNIVDSLKSVNARTLNIAGNGIYTMKGKYTQEQIDNFTYQLLDAIVKEYPIESIRTGGQTGFDEAGAKAGLKLGIPTTILAPKGWTYRDIKGRDISDEKSFKERFNNISQQGETIETLSLGIPTQQQVLKQFDQLNEDGTKKKKLVNDENYKRMVKEAQKINAGQSFYKATVGTIYGEEATIRSGRQYYVIQLTPRELSMRDRYNAISDKDVMDRIRKCRK